MNLFSTGQPTQNVLPAAMSATGSDPISFLIGFFVGNGGIGGGGVDAVFDAVTGELISAAVASGDGGNGAFLFGNGGTDGDGGWATNLVTGSALGSAVIGAGAPADGYTAGTVSAATSSLATGNAPSISGPAAATDSPTATAAKTRSPHGRGSAASTN